MRFVTQNKKMVPLLQQEMCMEELKIIYNLITSIWKLCKKYGTDKLTYGQWEAFVEDGQRTREIYLAKGSQYDMLYRGMFSALQEYYIQKGTSNTGS